MSEMDDDDPFQFIVQPDVPRAPRPPGLGDPTAVSLTGAGVTMIRIPPAVP